MHYFVYKDRFFYKLGKKAAADGELPYNGRGAAFMQSSPKVSKPFLSTGSHGGKRKRMLVSHV